MPSCTSTILLRTISETKFGKFIHYTFEEILRDFYLIIDSTQLATRVAPKCWEL